MTTDREQIIAAAHMVFLDHNDLTFTQIKTFYAIAFEAGRVAEREACAMEAEFYIKHSTIAKSIAEDIRARSTK